ncbi:integrase, catalytic region, zinc finger, CCHC-type containing protein [Tanacetum coccineum]
MVDVNVNAPAKQAPAMAPPARTDDQILPRIRWVPIGKRNCYLDVESSQSNPNYKIAVDILKHTKFFRAFTASLLIPSIYIQQFWDTVQYDNKTGNYSCQCPVRSPNNAFSSPPTPDALIKFVNDLGYSKVVRTLSDVVTNDMFQPWRALTTVINLCLTGKTSGYLKFSDKGTKQEVFGMPILNDLITDDIRGKQYYNAYLEKVAKHQRYLAGEKEKKRKLVTETSEAHLQPNDPKLEPKISDEEVDLQKAVEESLKEFHSACQGPLPPVVIREPESGKFQPLPEVQGKGKEKVSDEQVALDLLTLQTPKKRSPADQYIFQRRTSTQTEPTGHDESSSLYAELGLTDSETDSDEEVPGIDAGVQDEGQAGPNPDLEHMNLEASDTSLQPNPEQMDEEFTTTAYPNENLKLPTEGEFLSEKSQEDEPEKTNIEAERIGELEQHMADMVEANQALEERLDKQGSKLYKLENLNIPHQVSKAVDEIVTDAVDWAIQAPLSDRFRDLPEADMKEIPHHRMWESNSNLAHEDHKMLYEALEKLMARDHTDQLLTDLDEARRKKKKRRDSPKKPPGSLPHQPPPPPPPAGLSGTPGASGSSYLPPPPPPPYTNQSDHSTSTAALSSSKTVVLAEYTAWTTTDTRLKPSVLSIPEELHMDDDTNHDEQVQSSGDEDIGHDHIPTVNLRQNWWKPLTEDRPATTEPAWSIPSSDLHVPVNNWASALASTYAPPPENSLLAQTGPAYEIVKVFHPNVIHLQYQMEECHKLLTDQVDESIIRYNVSKPLPLGGPPGQVTIQSDFFFNKDFEYLRYGRKSSRPALSISKMKAAYYPDLGLEQMVPDQMWIEEECKYDIGAMDKYGVQMIMWFNEIHKFSDGTLQQIDEALDYRVKEFKVNRMNLGLNTRFWTRKDVDRSKEFMFSIQKRLKTRRIFRNLESFVGGRIREGDYRLLKRTE